MSKEYFDIVFSGETVKNTEVEQVKKNVGQLFKIGGATLNALFSGKRVTLKKQVDFDTATKYRVALKKAGAIVEMVEAVQPAVAEKSTQEKSAQENPSVNENTSTGSLSLAAMGGYLVNSNEVTHAPDVVVDISSLTLKENAGNLIEENEREIKEVAAVDTTSYSVAPEGTDVLTVSERKVFKAVDINTEALSLSELGTKLSDSVEKKFAPIDTSGISLKDNE